MFDGPEGWLFIGDITTTHAVQDWIQLFLCAAKKALRGYCVAWPGGVPGCVSRLAHGFFDPQRILEKQCSQALVQRLAARARTWHSRCYVAAQREPRGFDLYCKTR